MQLLNLNLFRSGFDITGGVFNYTARVRFLGPSSGKSAVVKFRFSGIDAFDYLKGDHSHMTWAKLLDQLSSPLVTVIPTPATYWNSHGMTDPHRSRSGRGFDFGSQPRFHWHVSQQ